MLQTPMVTKKQLHTGVIILLVTENKKGGNCVPPFL
jgi:hypothetical protein